MGIIRSPLPQNNGNLPLPFFGGNCHIVLLNNIYQSLYMYINWFTWIIFFHDRICYMKNQGEWELSKFSQRNGKLPLSRLKQDNYLLIPMYGTEPHPPWVSTPLGFKLGTFYAKLVASAAILLAMKSNGKALYWSRPFYTCNSFLIWVRLGICILCNCSRILCALVNRSSVSSNPVNMDCILVIKFSKDITISFF